MSNQVIYSSRLSLDLHVRRSYLESNGIECRINGEALLSVRPELPDYATLEVTNPSQVSTARILLQQFEQKQTGAVHQTWDCPSCAEKVEGQFTECWNCGTSSNEV